MARLSNFLGIVIYMYYRNHSPPHFQPEYKEFNAKISIHTNELLEGKLPPRVFGLVTEWASLHKDKLMTNWNLMKEGKELQPIEPLD